MRFESGNIFRKGSIPWNKNRSGVYSAGIIQQMKESAKNRLPSTRRGPKGKPWSEARKAAQKIYINGIRIKPILKNGKEYHPMWNEIRVSVYERDNYICQECGIKCVSDLKSKNRVNAHHVDYDEKNNDLLNIITLCVSCHGKTNFRRQYWINRFGGRAISCKNHG